MPRRDVTEPETRARRWLAWAAAVRQNVTEPETRVQRWCRILGGALCLAAVGAFWLSDGEEPRASWATWGAVAGMLLATSQVWWHPAFLAGGAAVGAYLYGGATWGAAGALLGGALLARLWPSDDSWRAAYAARRVERARTEAPD